MVNKCFVLMPFNEPFNQYYKTILIPAIKAAGLQPIRADEIYGTHAIIQDIFDGIRESAALVADVTGKNPNVNYELGIAHALNRPVVIISQSVDDIPFDYRHLRAIIYDTTKIDWPSDLSSKVTNTLLNAAIVPAPKSDTLGIKHVYKNRLEIKFIDYVLAVKPGQEIKLLATVLTDFNNRAIQSALENKLKDGCKVKMLILSPTSQVIKQRAIEENRDIQEWEDELIAVNRSHQNFIRRLSPELRQNIELRHYKSLPTNSVYAMGDTVIIGFYLRQSAGENTPHLELERKENSICDLFLNHFDSLWNEREAETDRTKAETDRIRFELQKTAEIPIATSETPQSHPLAHYSKFLAVGMETIHAHLTDDNIRERLKNSNYIRVLKTWFPENDQIEEGLISAIKNGADVELLLCKPESEILTERCKSAGENRCYAWVYRGIKKAYESMTATGNKKIKIVLYDSWPGCPVIWLDKEVLMGFYFRGKSSPRWPWVSVKAGTDLAGILDEQYKGLQGLTGNVWLDSSDKIKEWLEKNKIWE